MDINDTTERSAFPAECVADIMTMDPILVRPDAPLSEAARLMRDSAVGDVLVGDRDHLLGIVTDRDLVVRGLASDGSSGSLCLGDVCSGDPVTCSPETGVMDAVQLMRDAGLRRLPVVRLGRPVGIVTIGDLAMCRDPQSLLGQLSAAPPNN